MATSNTKGTNEEIFSGNSGHCIDVFISSSQFDQMCNLLMSPTNMTYRATQIAKEHKEDGHHNLTVIVILPSRLSFDISCSPVPTLVNAMPDTLTVLIPRLVDNFGHFWNRKQTTIEPAPG